MLDDTIFSLIIDSAPLISIDIVLKKDSKVSLGKRIHKPAQDYFRN